MVKTVKIKINGVDTDIDLSDDYFAIFTMLGDLTNAIRSLTIAVRNG